MGKGRVVHYIRVALRLAGLPTLVLLAVAQSVSLATALPFGAERTGLAALGAPYLYPTWGILILSGIYFALSLCFRRVRSVPKRIVARVVALASVVTITVAAMDVGMGSYLTRETAGVQFDTPDYAYLACESTRMGADNARTRFTREVQRLCDVYNIPYEGRAAVGDGFAATCPVDYHSTGVYGRAQYASNGLLAEGYVFSLEVALNILADYYRASEALHANLAAFNRCAGTKYATVDEALIDIRFAAKGVRYAYYHVGATSTDGADRGGTWAEEVCHSALCTVSEDRIHALLQALLLDIENSALLSSLAPFTTLIGGVEVADILRLVVGEEEGYALTTALDLADVRLQVRQDNDLCLVFSGGKLTEEIAFSLGDDIDERAFLSALSRLTSLSEEEMTNCFCALTDTADSLPDLVALDAYDRADLPLSALLARAIRAFYWYTPTEVLPLFDFYTVIPPAIRRGGRDEAGYAAFLSAAATYDRARYEGSAHGAAVGARLIGSTVGNGKYAKEAGVTSLAEAERLLWEIRHLPAVLVMLSLRAVLLYYGGVAVACTFLSTYLGLSLRPPLRRRHVRRRKKGRTYHGFAVHRRFATDMRALSLLALIVPIIAFSGGLLHALVAPAVTRISYGVVDGTTLAARPVSFARDVNEAKRRYLLFALLSGAVEPELSYDVLSTRTDGGYCHFTVQRLYERALAGEVLLGAENATLRQWIWDYYVLRDPTYSLALTEGAERRRRAFCDALTAYVLPAWRRLDREGLRTTLPRTSIDSLFAAEYRIAVEKGYAPLASSDALYLVLEDRATPSAILHLALDERTPSSSGLATTTERAISVVDVYGTPVILYKTTLPDDVRSEDVGPFVDACAALAAHDLSLPRLSETLAATGSFPAVVFYAEAGTVYLAAYPSAYLHGGVDYVSGTIIRYRIPLYALCFLLPFGQFLCFFSPCFVALWAARHARHICPRTSVAERKWRSLRHRRREHHYA